MRYSIKEETMIEIANAIRNKTGSDEVITASNMASMIESIRTAPDPIMEGLTVTPNGQEIVETPPFGTDGFGIVVVEGDKNLLPENIKTGVTIYGTEGILDPDSGIDTTDATATADDIVDGASAYVNGEKIIGTHVCVADPILSEAYAMPTGNEYVITPEEGVDGFSQVTVEGDENLRSENILAGTTIYGVPGTFAVQDYKNVKPGVEDARITPDFGYSAIGEVNVYGDSNLVPENIVKGVSIFGIKGSAIAGEDLINDKLQVKTVTPSTADIVLSPDEDYLGFSEVTVEGDPKLVPENIAEGVTIFGVKGEAIVIDNSDDDIANRTETIFKLNLLFTLNG